MSNDENNIELINCWPPVPNKNTLEISNNVSTSSRVKRALDDCNILCKNVRQKPKCKHFYVADTLLARWWKKLGSFLQPNILHNYSNCRNSKTLLYKISELPEAQNMLKEEVQLLQKQVDSAMNTDDLSRLYFCLGTIFEKLCLLQEASENLQLASKYNPESKEIMWIMHRVHRKINVMSLQQEHLKLLNLTISVDRCLFSTLQQVPRISVKELSYQEFLFNYALLGKPVVLTDIVSGMTTVPWSLEHVKQVAGTCLFMPKQIVNDSLEWARLEEDGTPITVGDYISGLPCQMHKTPSEQTYFFDWSLPTYCPQLAAEIIIPKFFSGDFLQRTAPGSLYNSSWPSLFIAPAGCRSELHVDAFGSNFWMAVFEGCKRWILFPREDFVNLYPEYGDTLDPVFKVDLSHPDIKKFPLLSLTQPMECYLKQGDLLFVPAGCPHRVENLEMSLAISSNFVDLSNLRMVKEELKVNALNDPCAENLLKQLESPNFCLKMCSKPQDLLWSEFHLCSKNSQIYDY